MPQRERERERDRERETDRDRERFVAALSRASLSLRLSRYVCVCTCVRREMAAKRISKEFRELEKDPPHSCSAGPVSAEVRRWWLPT